MASKRRLAELKGTRAENGVYALWKDTKAYFGSCVVWLYDNATAYASNCIVIRVNTKKAKVKGQNNLVVDFDNIPPDTYKFLVSEGVLNAV